MSKRKELRTRTHRAVVRRVFSFFFLVVFLLAPECLRSESFEDDILGQRRANRAPDFLWKRFGLPDCTTAPSLKRSRLRLWTHGFGNWSQISGRRYTSDLDTRSAGVSVGADQQFGRNFLLGVSFGSNWAKLKRKNNTSDEDISAAYGSLYFRTTLQRLYFDIEAGLGSNDVSYLSKSAFQWNVNAETGTWWEHGLGKVEPYLGLRHVSLDDDRTEENKTTLLAGLRYSWVTKGTYAVTSPRFYVGVIQELGDRNLLPTAMFSDAPTVYSLSGYEVEETRLFCGGGFTSSMGSSLDLYLRYTAEIASDDSSHTLMLGMNWNF